MSHEVYDEAYLQDIERRMAYVRRPCPEDLEGFQQHLEDEQQWFSDSFEIVRGLIASQRALAQRRG